MPTDMSPFGAGHRRDSSTHRAGRSDIGRRCRLSPESGGMVAKGDRRRFPHEARFRHGDDRGALYSSSARFGTQLRDASEPPGAGISDEPDQDDVRGESFSSGDESAEAQRPVFALPAKMKERPSFHSTGIRANTHAFRRAAPSRTATPCAARGDLRVSEIPRRHRCTTVDARFREHPEDRMAMVRSLVRIFGSGRISMKGRWRMVDSPCRAAGDEAALETSSVENAASIEFGAFPSDSS